MLILAEMAKLCDNCVTLFCCLKYNPKYAFPISKLPNRSLSGSVDPEVFCDAAIKGMERPDEYKQAQLGGECVILRKSKVK